MPIIFCTSCGTKHSYVGSKPSICEKCKSSFGSIISPKIEKPKTTYTPQNYSAANNPFELSEEEKRMFTSNASTSVSMREVFKKNNG